MIFFRARANFGSQSEAGERVERLLSQAFQVPYRRHHCFQSLALTQRIYPQTRASVSPIPLGGPFVTNWASVILNQLHSFHHGQQGLPKSGPGPGIAVFQAVGARLPKRSDAMLLCDRPHRNLQGPHACGYQEHADGRT